MLPFTRLRTRVRFPPSPLSYPHQTRVRNGLRDTCADAGAVGVLRSSPAESATAPGLGSIASVTTETTGTTGPGESRARYMLIFRGGAVSRDDVSPSVLQAHVEKWYRWSDELAREGRRNVGTALGNGGKAVAGHERVVTDGPYAESKDLVTGAIIIDAVSLEDAVEVARLCPTYEFGGSVEVRPVQD